MMDAIGGLLDGQVEERPIVCYLGPVASYSHQATLDGFPPEKWDLMPVVTISDIFTTVQSGNAAYGVIPFENSTNGPVNLTLNCLADHQTLYPSLSVCAEIYVDVHHYLLGFRAPPPPASDDREDGTSTPTVRHPHPAVPKSRPLVGLGHVRRLYSHPQVWGQCEAFLSTYLKGVEMVDVSSTSRAAELVAQEGPRGGSAALSSVVAWEVFRGGCGSGGGEGGEGQGQGQGGLEILGKCVEDREDNVTRFFVIRREGEGVELEDKLTTPQAVPTTNNSTEITTGKKEGIAQGTKSMLRFTVPHRHPGALADVLECFRHRGLNLTSISSRPSLKAPFMYVFFVEFEGHRGIDPEGRVKDALEEVDGVAESWKWLGSWVAQR